MLKAGAGFDDLSKFSHQGRGTSAVEQPFGPGFSHEAVGPSGPASLTGAPGPSGSAGPSHPSSPHPPGSSRHEHKLAKANAGPDGDLRSSWQGRKGSRHHRHHDRQQLQTSELLPCLHGSREPPG